MDKVYIPYKLSSKVIDWKFKWFYSGNHAPSLLDRTHRPPKICNEWIATAQDKDQVNKLLDSSPPPKKKKQIVRVSFPSYDSNHSLKKDK